MMTTLIAASIVLVAFLTALAALVVVGMLEGQPTSRLRSISATERGKIVFLFDDEDLIDATPSARELLSTGPRHGSDWARLASLITPRFPRLGEWIAELAELGEMQRSSKDGSSLLHAEWHEGIARITLSSVADPDNANTPDHHAHVAMTRELDMLRTATDENRLPMWQLDDEDEIVWCNRAYLDLAAGAEGPNDPDAWPPRKIFDGPMTEVTGDDGKSSLRASVTLDGEETRHWFDIDRQPYGRGAICTARPADRLVRAEKSLTEFVSTLSKTFASLPIGLVIFNRDRELTMFNPALLDLTALPIDFLLSKPTFSAFLDRLRGHQMMPEPKDYKSWRQRVSELVMQARNGTYEETWSLPGGQTYRVTGRPHPDGAVAFLFEDITTDVSLARRFRAEIEMGQSALDALPNAIAVFSSGGVMTMSNRAYDSLWNMTDIDDPEDMSIFEAADIWREATAPSRLWDQIRSFVGHAGVREAWQAQVTLSDGRPFIVRVVPLALGNTMVDFAPVTSQINLADQTEEEGLRAAHL